MKVLLTHRFFWPDSAPYGVMLRAIGDGWASLGHEVHVLSTMPSYRTEARLSRTPRSETLGALNVQRIRIFGKEKENHLRRLANTALYCWALFVTILRYRPDVVMASTFPPVIGAWLASLAAKIVGAKFIYHMQDIHPEVSFYAGGRLSRDLPLRVLRWLDNQTLLRSAAIVVLSRDMVATLAERQIGCLPVHVINNFSLDLFHLYDDPPIELRKRRGRCRVIFAGNLGRFQNLPRLAEGVSKLFRDFPDLELFFLGDGEALLDLKKRWSEHPQVVFGPFLPYAQAHILIRESDIGVASLESNLYKVAYPSKIATYLGAGLPVLALVERESQIAKFLMDNEVGMAPESSSPDDIAAAFRVLLKDLPSSKQVKEVHANTQSKERALRSWSKILSSFR